MRRGMLVVKRDAGDHLGSRMKGGTIMVLGPTGRLVGLGMRRGTIVLGQRPVEVARPQYQATAAMKPDEHEN